MKLPQITPTRFTLLAILVLGLQAVGLLADIFINGLSWINVFGIVLVLIGMLAAVEILHAEKIYRKNRLLKERAGRIAHLLTSLLKLDILYVEVLDDKDVRVVAERDRSAYAVLMTLNPKAFTWSYGTLIAAVFDAEDLERRLEEDIMLRI